MLKNTSRFKKLCKSAAAILIGLQLAITSLVPVMAEDISLSDTSKASTYKIADLDVAVVIQRQAALEALADFGDVVLLAPQRRDRGLRDDDAVADQARQFDGVLVLVAAGRPACGNSRGGGCQPQGAGAAQEAAPPAVDVRTLALEAAS